MFIKKASKVFTEERSGFVFLSLHESENTVDTFLWTKCLSQALNEASAYTGRSSRVELCGSDLNIWIMDYKIFDSTGDLSDITMNPSCSFDAYHDVIRYWARLMAIGVPVMVTCRSLVLSIWLPILIWAPDTCRISFILVPWRPMIEPISCGDDKTDMMRIKGL